MRDGGVRTVHATLAELARSDRLAGKPARVARLPGAAPVRLTGPTSDRCHTSKESTA